MTLARRAPRSEKTSLFGTAVHAVLRSRASRRPTAPRRPRSRPASDDHERLTRSFRRSRTCSSTSSTGSTRGTGGMRAIWAVAAQGTAADPAATAARCSSCCSSRRSSCSCTATRSTSTSATWRSPSRTATSQREAVTLDRDVRPIDVLRHRVGRSIEREMSDLMDRDRSRARVLVIPEGSRARLRPGRDGRSAGHPRRRQRQHGDHRPRLHRRGLRRSRRRRSAAACGRCWSAVAPRIWYNPELRSTLFLVPGLIAYISMITAVVSTALSIVREKETRHDGTGPHGADLHAGASSSARRCRT